MYDHQSPCISPINRELFHRGYFHAGHDKRFGAIEPRMPRMLGFSRFYRSPVNSSLIFVGFFGRALNFVCDRESWCFKINQSASMQYSAAACIQPAWSAVARFAAPCSKSRVSLRTPRVPHRCTVSNHPSYSILTNDSSKVWFSSTFVMFLSNKLWYDN